MKVVLQRVNSANVKIDNTIISEIQTGVVLLWGIKKGDTVRDADVLIKKIVNLRIFSDSSGKMNKSIQEISGQILLVSQFTLFAQTKKGNRPSFIQAAKPEMAMPIYEQTIAHFTQLMPNKIKTGVFAADMELQLINDGPVTIIMDTKDKERH